MTTPTATIHEEQIETTIVINDDYVSLVPGISSEDFESLKQSIKENGLYYAITVNQHGIILDGYQRYRACQELGTDPKSLIQYFQDPLLEQKFRIEANMNRRHLTPFQRIELQYKLETIENEVGKATDRMSNGGRSGAEKRWTNTDNESFSQNDND